MDHTTLICFKYKVHSKVIIQVYLNGDSAWRIMCWHWYLNPWRSNSWLLPGHHIPYKHLHPSDWSFCPYWYPEIGGGGGLKPLICPLAMSPRACTSDRTGVQQPHSQPCATRTTLHTNMHFTWKLVAIFHAGRWQTFFVVPLAGIRCVWWTFSSLCPLYSKQRCQ